MPEEKDIAAKPKRNGIGCVTIIGGIGVIVITVFLIGLMMGIYPKNYVPEIPKATEAVEAQPVKDAIAPIIINNNGEEFNGMQSNKLGFAISRTTKRDSIVEVEKVPDNEFIVIDVIVANNHESDITLTSANFRIIDNALKEYSPSAKGIKTLKDTTPQDFAGIPEIAAKNVVTKVSLVFDIPKDTVEPRLQISNNILANKLLLPIKVEKISKENKI